MIGTVFQCTPDPTDPECYQSGMSVREIGDPIALTISLNSFTAPNSAIADGTINLNQHATDAQTVLMAAATQIANHPDRFSSVQIDGSFSWGAGKAIGASKPDSIQGTFTVDGTPYSLEAVLAADGGAGNGGADTSLTSLPAVFRTAICDSAQLKKHKKNRLT